ncbi:hypothetical protein WDU99_13880 [Microbacterium sp. Mu-80]|uniref:Uncharacterized protein n=1 Tax=Microbacterium bandirmense TaxID=3122050 RepID=A0ABU8LDI4_9MICO
MRRTRSQIRAAEIAALIAEQQAYDKKVNDAVKIAALARCDAVEQLYELLDVLPDRPTMRTGKNGPYEVASDKDERKRCARLVDTVANLLATVAADRESNARDYLGSSDRASGPRQDDALTTV